MSVAAAAAVGVDGHGVVVEVILGCTKRGLGGNHRQAAYGRELWVGNVKGSGWGCHADG
jgi:hypothetical protein